MSMKIGFIGLGIMGAPMAEHLHKAGHQLFLNTIGDMPAWGAGSSATVCDTAKAVTQQADIIITMVPDTPDVEAVLFSANGVAEGAIRCEAPCLGYSFTKNEPVLQLILDRLPATIFLAMGAFVIFLIGGVAIGVYSALRRGRWQDKTAMGISLVGYSLPSFFIGLVVIYFVITGG